MDKQNGGGRSIYSAPFFNIPPQLLAKINNKVGKDSNLREHFILFTQARALSGSNYLLISERIFFISLSSPGRSSFSISTPK
jgi:hypothetical protein